MQLGNGTHHQDAEAIFNAALQRHSAAERAAFLDGACRGNDRMYARVESLLAAHEQAGDFLLAQTTERPIEGPGEQIGRYKTLQKIGEGGFGTVYMAEQIEPVRRRVALKIIKLGMDTKQVIARFEAERQALALMDHVNIAKVFDAGATESGRPYFVMELVRGMPITEFCDRSNLGTRERLELFMDVCGAIQHAHQKGIIHRDIKPTNVMVTMHDGRPVPKIIDFGVSKATNQRLTEKTLFTEYHQFIGTPQYMSPEQAEMSGLDIDTRSDLYSLGALLYELLTGTPPFEPQTLREAGYAEIQRIICQVEPPKPSTRVVTLVEKNTTLGEHHGVQPQMLSRTLQGELDWIVMKAMDKDRTRRYATANELASDINRFLTDLPVVAAPPGAFYYLQKFVRRHRLGVIASCLIAASLIVGCTLAVIGLLQASHDRDSALHAEQRASQAAVRTQRIADYLQDVLVVSDPQRGLELADDVDGLVQRGLDVFEGDRATVAATLDSLSLQLQSAGNYAAAEQLLNESIRLWTATMGPSHPNISIALGRLGELLRLKGDDIGSRQAFRQAIEIADKQGQSDSPYVATALCGLAELLQNHGDFTEAEMAVRRALDIRRRVLPHQKLEIAVTVNRLANVLSMSGNISELDQVLDETVAAFRAAIPNNHAVIAKILTQSAAFHIDQNNFEKAEKFLRDSMAIYRRDPTASKFYREVGVRLLGVVVDRQDDASEEYVQVRRQFVSDARELLGEDHPKLGLMLSDYASYMVDRNQPLDAIRLATDALKKLVTTLGTESYIKGALVALERASRQVVLQQGRSMAHYQLADDGVSLLLSRQPNDRRAQLIQAALKYRLEQHEAAASMLNSWEADSDEPSEDRCLHIGFLAMTHHQLGQHQQAIANRDQLKQIQSKLENQSIDGCGSLLDEVETLFDEKTRLNDHSN